MPVLTRITVRLSLFYLIAGWTLGAALLINRAWGFDPQLSALIPLHIFYLFFGCFLQLAIGIAYWILPTFGRRDQRGRESFAWASMIGINAALIFKTLAEVWGSPSYIASHLLIVAGALLFCLHAWPRVKGFGSEGH